MNEKNLKPVRTTKEARERGRRGGIASGKARRERRMLSEIYKDFLTKKYSGKYGDTIAEDVVRIILSRCDAPSVALLKEMREATEGNKNIVEIKPLEIQVKIVKPGTT